MPGMRRYEVGDEPIPGYHLSRFLGQGGFGQVWAARGPGDIDIALKIIGLGDSQGLKEFRAVRLVKQLRHPNLVPLYAFWLKDEFGNVLDGAGEDSMMLRGRSNELLLAMGLGEKSLAQRLEECLRDGQSGIPFDELYDYMDGAARAIDYLNQPTHTLGSGPPAAIQHCDIKPGNLLIVGGGVQVCDYGLARALTSDAKATKAAGTPAYCAPELFGNKPSAWTDQYSLAISYYELRTGFLPFDEGAAIAAHMTGNLDFSRLPQPEQEVLRKATHSRPDHRFARTLDMVHTLRKASRRPRTAKTEPPPPPRRPVEPSAAIEKTIAGKSQLPSPPIEKTMSSKPPPPAIDRTMAGPQPKSPLADGGSGRHQRPDTPSVIEVVSDRPPTTRTTPAPPQSTAQRPMLESMPTADPPRRNNVRETPAETGSAASLDELIRVGIELVPGYRLARLLGRGGYGEVWEARGPGNMPVALKIVRNLDANQGKQEFKSLDLIRDLEHDHLIKLQAYWLLTASGRVVPDDELGIPGGAVPNALVVSTDLAVQNLLQYLAACQQQGQPGVPARELIAYTRQSAEAIDYLNANNIQHRDIKPENILLTRGKRVKVSDFGLAKIVEGSSSAIHSMSVGLTLAYAAPEMFRNTVSRWTDQYSLALTYYKLRTGQLPFAPDLGPIQMMQAHAEGRLDFSMVGDEEAAVLRQATALEPSSRYGSCLEMVAGLEQALGISSPVISHGGGSAPIIRGDLANPQSSHQLRPRKSEPVFQTLAPPRLDGGSRTDPVPVTATGRAPHAEVSAPWHEVYTAKNATGEAVTPALDLTPTSGVPPTLPAASGAERPHWNAGHATTGKSGWSTGAIAAGLLVVGLLLGGAGLAAYKLGSLTGGVDVASGTQTTPKLTARDTRSTNTTSGENPPVVKTNDSGKIAESDKGPTPAKTLPPPIVPVIPPAMPFDAEAIRKDIRSKTPQGFNKAFVAIQKIDSGRYAAIRGDLEAELNASKRDYGSEKYAEAVQAAWNCLPGGNAEDCRRAAEDVRQWAEDDPIKLQQVERFEILVAAREARDGIRESDKAASRQALLDLLARKDWQDSADATKSLMAISLALADLANTSSHQAVARKAIEQVTAKLNEKDRQTLSERFAGWDMLNTSEIERSIKTNLIALGNQLLSDRKPTDADLARAGSILKQVEGQQEKLASGAKRIEIAKSVAEYKAALGSFSPKASESERNKLRDAIKGAESAQQIRLTKLYLTQFKDVLTLADAKAVLALVGIRARELSTLYEPVVASHFRRLVAQTPVPWDRVKRDVIEPNVRNGVVQAALAEQLYESTGGMPSGDDVQRLHEYVEAMNGAMPGTAAGKYGAYVRALVAVIDRADNAARDLAQIFSEDADKESTAILAADFRRERAGKILFAAARELKQKTLQPLEPLYPQQDLDAAVSYLGKAYELCGARADADLAAQLALAANQKGDVATAAKVLRDLGPRFKDVKDDAVPLLLLRAQVLRDEATVSGYVETIRAVERLREEYTRGIPSLKLSEALLQDVVAPALDLAPRQGISETSAPGDRQLLAEIYEEKANILSRHPKDIKDALRLGMAAYDDAIRIHDSAPAAYYCERGVLKLVGYIDKLVNGKAVPSAASPEWLGIIADRDKAIEIDAKKPAGRGYAGTFRFEAVVLQADARLFERPNSSMAVKKYKDADAKYAQALEVIQRTPLNENERRENELLEGERPKILINRCALEMDLANALPEDKERYLNLVVENADKATALRHREPWIVSKTKGIALEDLAWQLDYTEKYDVAAEALRRAVKLAGEYGKAGFESECRVDLGRCLIRAAEFGRKDPAKNLREAVSELGKAVQSKDISKEWVAQGYLRLGTAEWLQQNYTAAAADFQKGGEAGSSTWSPQCWFGLACVLVDDAGLQLRKVRKQPAAALAQNARDLVPKLDAVSAGYIRGRCQELDNKIKEAFDEYTAAVAALPGDSTTKSEPYFRALFAARGLQADTNTQDAIPKKDLKLNEAKKLAEDCDKNLAFIEKLKHDFSAQLRSSAYGVTGMAYGGLATEDEANSAEHRKKALEKLKIAISLSEVDSPLGWKWRFQAARQMEKLKVDKSVAIKYLNEALQSAPAVDRVELNAVMERLKAN